MKFKVNFHVAKQINETTIEQMINNYPKQYSTPKYLYFIQNMIKKGWSARLHQVEVSKYVFVYRSNTIFKIRFSNHKPIKWKQMRKDCDFYVGISHQGKALLTEDVINLITEEWDSHSSDREWTQKECEEADEREAEAEWHDDLPND